MDGYNHGALENPAAWQPFTSVFGATYAAITKLAPTKPVMIAGPARPSTAVQRPRGSRECSQACRLRSPPSKRWSGSMRYDGSYDWPLKSSASATAAFSAGIARSVFTSNSFSAAAQSPIAAP